MEKLNVAIADDNEKMVEVLSKIIDQDEDLKLVGKAHNGEEICNIIKDSPRDCNQESLLQLFLFIIEITVS